MVKQNKGGTKNRPDSKIPKSAETQMIRLLQYIDNILSIELWILDDLRYWKTMDNFALEHTANADAVFIESYAKSAIVKLDAALAELVEVKSGYQKLKENLEEALTVVGLHENYQDKLVRNRRSWIGDADATPALIDPSHSFSRIDGPLKRVAILLEQFEELFCLSVTVAGMKSESDGSLSNSQRFRLNINQTERDECRIILAELLNAETELRTLSLDILHEEKEKLWLWQKRILVAEKIGDSYLALRATKRKEIHETAVEFLEQRIMIDPSKLPASFSEARSVVERVEQKLGLQASALLRKNDHLFAFTLFDRILFLVESLDCLLDQELQAEPELGT